MSECPTCGSTFDTETGMKIHHTKAHGEQLGDEPDGPACPTCGDRFADESGMKIHHARGHGESIAGVEVECAWCGESFRRNPAKVEGVDRSFCDMECRDAWMKDNWQDEGHPDWQQVEVECDYCGEATRRKQSMLDFARYFCDADCQAAYQAENWPSGDDHPNWSETPPSKAVSYGLGWNESKRESVRERDGRACQGCGRSEDTNLDEFGVKLHVHHITPARDFDNPRERNAMENLISLCSVCHPQWERMSPLRPERVSIS